MDEADYYLTEGPQTGIDNLTIVLAMGKTLVQGKELDAAVAVIKAMRDYYQDLQDKDPLEVYLLFTKVMRKIGIPVKWIEALPRRARSGNGAKPEYFLDMLVNRTYDDPGCWMAADPLSGSFVSGEDRYRKDYKSYTPIRQGLDPGYLFPYSETKIER